MTTVKITKDEAFLILNFYIQHMIDFIDEHGLGSYQRFQQLPKNAIRKFSQAIETQIDFICKGPAVKQFNPLCNEAFEQLHAGTIEIGEYFKMQFNLAELPEEKQAEFVNEYNSLLEKYQLNR